MGLELHGASAWSEKTPAASGIRDMWGRTKRKEEAERSEEQASKSISLGE